MVLISRLHRPESEQIIIYRLSQDDGWETWPAYSGMPIHMREVALAELDLVYLPNIYSSLNSCPWYY